MTRQPALAGALARPLSRPLPRLCGAASHLAARAASRVVSYAASHVASLAAALALASGFALPLAAHAEETAICYNCPPEWADWASQIQAIQQKTGIRVPFDNKNSGQAIAQMMA